MVETKELKLWPHQKEAVRKAVDYINTPYADKSFLLKLPTGSGKTGIMATIARVSFTTKNILIVVPSIALRKQLFDHISTKFWETINVNTNTLAKKEIHELVPSTFDNIKSEIENKPFVLIMVVNTLHLIRKENADNYKLLKEKIDFIIFDEGHREPAYSWANAVRSLEKQILLFTATPFRNDLRLFNVDKENYYPLFHIDAVNSRIIRDIDIDSNPIDLNDLDNSLALTIKTIQNKTKSF
jgi:superfamily II DNA or RNA helicase